MMIKFETLINLIKTFLSKKQKRFALKISPQASSLVFTAESSKWVISRKTFVPNPRASKRINLRQLSTLISENLFHFLVDVVPRVALFYIFLVLLALCVISHQEPFTVTGNTFHFPLEKRHNLQRWTKNYGWKESFIIFQNVQKNS